MVTAGEMRHRVTIQAQVETKTARGGFAAGAPSVLARRREALCEQLTGHELQRQLQIDPRADWRVTTWYVSGVQARQAVIYHSFRGDLALEVVAPPVVDAASRQMVLMCREAA